MQHDTPCAGITLRHVTRVVTAAHDAALAPLGLRITHFPTLSKLARLGPLPVTGLAAEAALDRSTTGRPGSAIDALADRLAAVRRLEAGMRVRGAGER